MLSVYMQKLMIGMLMGQITRTSETKQIYGNSYAFYRAINYLIRSGMVIKKRSGDHLSIYGLTLRGEMLVRILLSLDDIPADLKQYISVFRTERKIDLEKVMRELR